MSTDTLLAWLLDGDPAIRWQARRDLLGEPPAAYEPDRARVATEGWGSRLLALQHPDRHLGQRALLAEVDLHHLHPAAVARTWACRRRTRRRGGAASCCWNRGFYRDGGINLFKSWKTSETCVTGMVLALLGDFRCPDDRVHRIVEHLLGQQMADGGWNCERPRGATHGSFHTTISVLEGLHEYALAHPARAAALDDAVARGHEFLLIHRLYRSHRTGEVADPAMARITFPPRWHYDFLRGLDYFRWVGAPRDERMADAIALLPANRPPTAAGISAQNYPGRVFFEMEKVGQPSRWNTLRGLRVLRWWEGCAGAKSGRYHEIPA